MAMPTVSNDPFDTASNPTPRAIEVYGLLSVNAWYARLAKGEPRVAFDPAQHDPKTRATVIDVAVTPLPEMNLNRPLERSMIDTEPKWYKVTWPSAQALGVSNARQLANRYCKATLAPTGKTYVDRQSGDTRDELSIKLLALYPDEAACRAAMLSERPSLTPPPPPQSNNGTDPERETATAFLYVLLNNAFRGAKDVDEGLGKLTGMIAAYPIVSKFYNPVCTEVAEWVKAQKGWDVLSAGDIPF